MSDIKALLEKYYDGETSLEEENRIRDYFAQHPEMDTPDARLFGAIGAAKSYGTPAVPRERRFKMLRNMAVAGSALAAGLALVIGLRQPTPRSPKPDPARSMATRQTIGASILVSPKASGEIQDEQQALEQARKALAFVSSKLNKGINGIHHFNKLEQSISKIQNKEKS